MKKRTIDEEVTPVADIPAAAPVAVVDDPPVYAAYTPAALPQANGHPANCVCVACLDRIRMGL